VKNILNLFNLEKKTAAIIGGAGVLGSAIAEGLGRVGCHVAICDISDTQKTVEKFNVLEITTKGYYIDVLDTEKIRDCQTQVVEDFGQVDILVNAAGGNIEEATISKNLSFFDITPKAFEKVVALNLFGGAILPAQEFGKIMINNENGGSIINIASMSAFRPLTKVVGYSAAKAAVSNFTQWLAVYLAQEYNKKLRVNAIAPGFFHTTQNNFLLYDENGNLTPRGESIIAHTPMHEFGKPEDLIGACIWLASNASRFVTGAVIPIDGGFGAFTGV